MVKAIVTPHLHNDDHFLIAVSLQFFPNPVYPIQCCQSIFFSQKNDPNTSLIKNL